MLGGALRLIKLYAAVSSPHADRITYMGWSRLSAAHRSMRSALAHFCRRKTATEGSSQDDNCLQHPVHHKQTCS
jgi:hypothetical protein